MTSAEASTTVRAGTDGAARLCALSIRDFRNLPHVELAPPEAGLVIVGENGQGKTNLLEAIYYLELVRSVRGARDQDLVRFGAPGFHIAARVESDRAREIAVGFERAGRRKRVRLDGVVCERLSDAVGALPVVMFSPADVELIAGSPAARRRYVDILLAVTSRAYLNALQRYRSALAHRNAALRDAARRSGGRVRWGVPGDARIAVWEALLAEHGAVLWTERRAWTERVAARFQLLCRAIGESGPVMLRYASALPAGVDASSAREALAAQLEQQRAVDVRRGVTSAGPHRDDLVVTLDGRDLRIFGSAGQQRTAAIALRLLESETLRERRGGAPLFLLDDPFAELDARRSARIVEMLADTGIGQTVLAVPRASDIPSGGGLPRLERQRIVAGELHPMGTRD
ncbi:MAG TPA: DNA replication and repair protein RecF [Gemmatimonadaceae bacterium]|nr:DNA replication and repair protein RecF [Gemmatimonadaceae bacterium]